MRGGSSSSSASDSRRGLMRDDALGITFEHCGADEAEFLYEEIFTRRAYLQGGVQFPLTDTPSEPAVVVDAGANIGLFSLHCLALAPRATIIAVEPSPTAFAALERNLSGHASAACERLCLADVAAPQSEDLVALDHHAQEEGERCGPRQPLLIVTKGEGWLCRQRAAQQMRQQGEQSWKRCRVSSAGSCSTSCRRCCL